jgi:streptogramin lyase
MPQPFKCPSCGGPLDYDGGNITIRCPFCTNSVIVPEELRTRPAHNSAPAPWHDQMAKLSEIGQLIRSGNKIAAIKLYRETFHVGLKEAKDAVENLAAGRPVEVSRTIEMGGNYPLNPQQIPNWPTPEAMTAIKKTGCSVLVVVIVITAFVFVFGIGLAIYFISTAHKTTRDLTARPETRERTMPTMPGMPKTPAGSKTTTPAFASLVLEFGSEGIGAGQFKDSRSIAVDGEGRIYLGEYTGGRIQVFDREGNFLTQWLVDPKMPLRALAADRKGTVYVVQRGDINRYEGLTGKSLGKVQEAERSGNYDDVVITLNGGMVAVNRGEDIVSLDADGQIVRIIKASISEQSGDSELDTRVAVDGLGNIYALGTFNDAVFKFGPNGKYVTRFGGEGNEPGQFRAAHGVAVDGQGRVYVSDIKGIQVFDDNGRYLDVFKLEKGLPFGMIFNDKNELFVTARTRVYKFTVK